MCSTHELRGLLMMCAGLRIGEACDRRPQWLSERIAALTETVKPDAVRESLRRGGVGVGIGLNPHMLRHWYATTLLARVCRSLWSRGR